MGWGNIFFVVILVGCALGNLNRELYSAAGFGNLPRVKAAITNGGDINWRNPDWFNYTPLLKACDPTIHLEVVTLLLEAGADPNAATSDSMGGGGRTPLIFASRWKSNVTVATAVTQQLIAAGANVNLVDRSGKTALHWAAWYNLTDAALLLLGAGADPRAQYLNGETPLGRARRNNNLQLAELLESLASATPRIVPDFTTIIIVTVVVGAIKQLIG